MLHSFPNIKFGLMVGIGCLTRTLTSTARSTLRQLAAGSITHWQRESGRAAARQRHRHQRPRRKVRQRAAGSITKWHREGDRAAARQKRRRQRARWISRHRSKVTKRWSNCFWTRAPTPTCKVGAAYVSGREKVVAARQRRRLVRYKLRRLYCGLTVSGRGRKG